MEIDVKIVSDIYYQCVGISWSKCIKSNWITESCYLNKNLSIGRIFRREQKKLEFEDQKIEISLERMLNFIVLATLFGCAFGQFYDICQDKPFGAFIKDFTSCKSYIACAEKYSIYGDCPDGLMFDEEKGMCDYADTVKCNVCPPVGLQSFSIKGSCDKFVRCVNGVGNYMKCSAGLFFDQKLGSCNVRHEVDCEQDICESGEKFVPSHEDCAA